MTAEPPRPTGRRRGPDGGAITVFVADERAGASRDADEGDHVRDTIDTTEPCAAIDHPVDAERWAALAEQVLEAEGVEGEAELSVLFVDEDHITQLNQQFMGHDGPTDVLSFPIDGVPEPPTVGLTPPGRAPFDPDDQPLLLGDVVICPAVADRQAPEHAGRYDDEIALLLVHGILHLLGMDHAEDAERDAMQAREHALLERFHGVPARDPWVT
jgi:probable rRNA maturation factor